MRPRLSTSTLFPYTPLFFFFNDTATTEIYTLSLHDALPMGQDLPGQIRARAVPTLGPRDHNAILRVELATRDDDNAAPRSRAAPWCFAWPASDSQGGSQGLPGGRKIGRASCRERV